MEFDPSNVSPPVTPRHEEASQQPATIVMLPSPALRAFVRTLEYHPCLQEKAAGRIHIWPHPYQTLHIRLGDPLEVFETHSGLYRVLPDVMLSGPITIPIADLMTRGGGTAQFLIVFQPGGALRLLGIPPAAMTDKATAAEDILGTRVRVLVERIRAALTPQEMVAVAESFLSARADQAPRSTPVERAAEAQLGCHGRVPIAELIRSTGHDASRFERTFLRCVGVTPKLFARLARFDYVLRLRAGDPGRSWTSITHEAAYFDQNHLVKDFKSMTGRLPSDGHDPQWRISGGDGLAPQAQSVPMLSGSAGRRRPPRRGELELLDE